MELLLENGADVNAMTSNQATSLAFAAWEGQFNQFQNVHYKENNEIFCLGQYNVTKLLIERGADVNAATNENESPLSFAAQNGN